MQLTQADVYHSFYNHMMSYGKRLLIYTGNDISKEDVVVRKQAWNALAVLNIRGVKNADKYLLKEIKYQSVRL